MQLKTNTFEKRRLIESFEKNQKTIANKTSSNSNDRKQIVALIPRGEVIRNFFYTDALDEISAEAEISLLTISADAELDKMLEERFGKVYPLEEFREKRLVRFQREIIDMAHGRWLWSKAAQERWRLRDSEAVSFKQKAFRMTKKAICFPFASRRGIRLLSKMERTSSRILRTTDEYINLMKKLEPSIVFNGSHIHSRNAIQAVQAAQWLGIPTATFIFSWDNLTSQGRITLPYDYFLVWNEQLKQQLLEMYEWIRPEQIFITGTPQFDFHFQPKFYKSREEFCKEIRADSNRPIILYSTGMPNHMPGEPEIVEEIADMLKEIGGENQPQLLVRVYPKDLTGRFDKIKVRRTDILFPKIEWEEAWLTPKFEDSYALVNTLRHCALGINVASTIALELCMFDKPAICVGYNPKSIGAETLKYADYYDFDHYRPVIESGAVEVAWDTDQMRELIKENLKQPERKSSERRALIKKMFGKTLDGNSAKRVAKVLLELSGKVK